MFQKQNNKEYTIAIFATILLCLLFVFILYPKLFPTKHDYVILTNDNAEYDRVENYELSPKPNMLVGALNGFSLYYKDGSPLYAIAHYAEIDKRVAFTKEESIVCLSSDTFFDGCYFEIKSSSSAQVLSPQGELLYTYTLKDNKDYSFTIKTHADGYASVDINYTDRTCQNSFVVKYSLDNPNYKLSVLGKDYCIIQDNNLLEILSPSGEWNYNLDIEDGLVCQLTQEEPLSCKLYFGQNGIVEFTYQNSPTRTYRIAVENETDFSIYDYYLDSKIYYMVDRDLNKLRLPNYQIIESKYDANYHNLPEKLYMYDDGHIHFMNGGLTHWDYSFYLLPAQSAIVIYNQTDNSANHYYSSIVLSLNNDNTFEQFCPQGETYSSYTYSYVDGNVSKEIVINVFDQPNIDTGCFVANVHHLSGGNVIYNKSCLVLLDDYTLKYGDYTFEVCSGGHLSLAQQEEEVFHTYNLSSSVQEKFGVSTASVSRTHIIFEDTIFEYNTNDTLGFVYCYREGAEDDLYLFSLIGGGFIDFYSLPDDSFDRELTSANISCKLYLYEDELFAMVYVGQTLFGVTIPIENQTSYYALGFVFEKD